MARLKGDPAVLAQMADDMGTLMIEEGEIDLKNCVLVFCPYYNEVNGDLWVASDILPPDLNERDYITMLSCLDSNRMTAH